MPTDYDVGKALARIENEMITSMMRNIERHIREQEEEGFEWSQWQVEELRSLEEYRKKNQKKYGPQFKEINKRMLKAIEEAKERGSSDQEIEILEALRKGHIPDRMMTPNGDITGPISNSFFGINKSKMDALVKATENDMQRAEYAVLRRANDQYRRIIFDAEVYANSGAGTVEKAVDMATKDFLSRGIDSIQYSNGARHTISDYADMVIKTAETRAYLMGQGEKRAEWGEQLVIVNKRAGDYPCPHCIPWVGKILIDDVYSGGKPDGKHKLLSEAIAAGFLHPRCRDIFTTYFPGISSEPDPVTKAEAKEAAAVEHKENQQQYAERQAEKFGRLAEFALDPDNKRMYGARAEQWTEKADELTERRKNRLAQRKATLPESNESIAFDERVSDKQRQLIEDLSAQYRTRLQQVMLGAEKAAGDVDISGARMRLNDKHAHTAVHEFAHTLANSRADKYGLTSDGDFWKEIKQIRREYMKAVEGDPSRWISTYEHSGRSLDEFMAEAFTHAKMRELGLKIPDKYGSDFTYSQRVLDAVDKYFGKNLSESGEKMQHPLRTKHMSIIGDIINPPDEDVHIDWPVPGDPISKEKYHELSRHVRSKGIEITGFKHYDGDIETVKEFADELGEMLDIYPDLKKGRRRITLNRTDVFSDNPSAFAATDGHIVSLSNAAYRDGKRLAEEYVNGVVDGTFAAGTTSRSVAKHEFGHLIEEYYDIDPFEVACKVTGITSKTALQDYVEKHLSKCAAGYADGREIISESFASVFGSSEKNTFALKIVQECNKIITSKGGQINDSRLKKLILEIES